MTDVELLEKLKEIAQKLDIELRWDEGEFAGGYCRMGGRDVVFVNRLLPTASQVDVLSRGLGSFDLSNVFMLPAVRKRIVRSADGASGRRSNCICS